MLSLLLVGLLAISLMGLILIMFYLFFYKKCKKRFKKYIDSVKSKIFWNTLLRTSIQQYIDITISSMVALKTFTNEPHLSLNIFVTILTIIVLLVYPILTKKLVKR